MEVELIHINHSIPDAVAWPFIPRRELVVTPVIQIDTTPIERWYDRYCPLCRTGKQRSSRTGGRLHNVEKPGYSVLGKPCWREV